MAAATPKIHSDLVDALKRLRLGRLAATLPERLVLAEKQEVRRAPAHGRHRRDLAS
jgi:hypothetical protein